MAQESCLLSIRSEVRVLSGSPLDYGHLPLPEPISGDFSSSFITLDYCGGRGNNSPLPWNYRGIPVHDFHDFSNRNAVLLSIIARGLIAAKAVA